MCAYESKQPSAAISKVFIENFRYRLLDVREMYKEVKEMKN